MPEQRSEWTFKGSPLNRTIADEVFKPKPLRGSALKKAVSRLLSARSIGQHHEVPICGYHQ